MSDLAARIAALSPERQAQLARMVGRDGLLSNAFQLSLEQQRLWFLAQLAAGSGLYNIPLALRFSGILTAAALGQSWGEVRRRHDVLRTSFVAVRGEPFQVVGPSRPQPLPLIDLRGLTLLDRDALARRLAAEESRRPFDLQGGSPARTTLLLLAADEHVVLVTMHHIVADGWSTGVLLRELVTLYGSCRAGRPSPLPPLRHQYKDFVRWQRERLSGERLASEIEYWKRHLAGAPAETELPTDRPRPAVPTFRGASVRVDVPPAIWQPLKALALRLGSTSFQILVAAFAALLARHSRQMDVVLGTAVANRGRPELEALVGFFVNTVVLRLDVAGDPTFEALVGRARDTTLDAFAHQDLPFEKLVESLHPERVQNRTPIFQVAIDFQAIPTESWRLPNLHVSGFDVESRIAKFDLRLSIRETSTALACSFEYASDLFDRETIAQLGDRLCALLGEVATAPHRRLSQLTMLTPAERDLVLHRWNDTRRDVSWPSVAHACVDRCADDGPDTIAVVWEGEHLTYRELTRRANRVARYLRSIGVGVETLVGICLERSPEMIVAMLGVLKAGGAYLPLDPDNPRERLRFLIEDSGAALVLSRPHLASKLPQTAARVLFDAERASVEGLPDWRHDRPYGTGQNLAYVIYTSGSTGTPKGAALTHDALCNLAAALSKEFAIERGSRVLQFSFFNFDAAVAEIFTALFAGATVHLPKPHDVVPGPGFVSLLRERQISALIIPPSALAAVPAAVLPDLRALIVAGEPCGTELVDQWAPGRHFYDAYGPTEATVCASFSRCRERGGRPHIGRPIANVRTYVLGADFNLAPIGVAGELHIGGVGVGRGYLHRPGLTAEKFVPDPYGEPGARLYRSGDVVRLLRDGTLSFVGRLDHQVKVRGFRVELGEIEAVLRSHPAVHQAAVVARGEGHDDKRVVAYVVSEADERGLRAYLEPRLPAYMLPSSYVRMEALPRNSSGKLDVAALPDPRTQQAARATDFRPPQTSLETTIAGIWCEVLKIGRVGLDDNFFEIGGHSLLLVRVHSALRDALGVELALVDLFTYPTVHALAAHVHGLCAGVETSPVTSPAIVAPPAADDPYVAIVGMSLRLPGSTSADEFWTNLRDGRELITVLSDEELLAAGVPAATLADPNYVKAAASLDGMELFDAGFFGISPRQAVVMDPQHRVFLECAWTALEDAGYAGETAPGPIGVYAGAGLNTYLLNVLANPAILQSVGGYQAVMASEKDHLTTRASYLLNLQGPSVTVQTSCSTSLVAVHLACRSLIGRECDMALAGGVSIDARATGGYLFQEGGTLSPDGHCRAFDAKAAGTVGASGAAIVVLKRLADAIRDGDTVHAVVRGSAINNDGSAKVGYTAPGVEQQAAVIRAAQVRAGVTADQISYVEAHGTGTALGDPIEVAALTRAFRATTTRTQYCALGALKTATGHLDAAAGVAGLIKTTLALEHGAMPPTLHFQSPNPQIDFANSPFFVDAQLREWPTEAPRLAGVSSFGIGGTNAHVIVERAPATSERAPSRRGHLLLLSARTPAALNHAAANLARHLETTSEEELADVAYTLQVGRRVFPHRRAVICRSVADARDALAGRAPDRSIVRSSDRRALPLVLLFSGHGSQYVDMGRELYEHEPVFRSALDRCAEHLEPELGLDFRRVLYPAPDAPPGGAERLGEMSLAQPIMFALEYALAQLWMSWTGAPAAMMGHSMGEYVAACLSGVFSLEDALMLIAARGRLLQSTAAGSMLAVPLTEADVVPLLGSALSLAAINGPARCVVSGPAPEVERLHQLLAGRGVESRPLHVSVAGHSTLLDPIQPRFAEEVRKVALSAPRIPLISNVTGTWLTAAQATDPSYWVEHLRRTVRFADGLREIWRSTEGSVIEIGPGRSLTTLALQDPERPPDREALSSLRHAQERTADLDLMLASLGRLWTNGARVDWDAFQAGTRRRVPLPTYPFERQRYWLERSDDSPAPRPAGVGTRMPSTVASWSQLDPARPHDRERVEAGSSNGASEQAEPTALERELAVLWEELLGRPVGLHDNFFELGGDSLIALHLTARIRRTLNVTLPLRRLLESPTVRALAAVIDATHRGSVVAAPPADDAPTPSGTLVTIQAGTPSRLPFFSVHAGGGTVLCYASLARHLGPDRPVYALQAPGLEAGQPRFDRVEELAAFYVSAIRAVQEKGPYLIGGWSAGGLIAFEIASQLEAMGEDAPCVVLMDTYAPADDYDFDELKLLMWQVARFRLTVPVEELARLGSFEERVRAIVERATEAGRIPAHISTDDAHRGLMTEIATLKAVLGYHAGPFSGELRYFRCQEKTEFESWNELFRTVNARDHVATWHQATGAPVIVHEVPGDHAALMSEPNVQVVAAELRACLERTEHALRLDAVAIGADDASAQSSILSS